MLSKDGCNRGIISKLSNEERSTLIFEEEFNCREKEHSSGAIDERKQERL